MILAKTVTVPAETGRVLADYGMVLAEIFDNPLI